MPKRVKLIQIYVNITCLLCLFFMTPICCALALHASNHHTTHLSSKAHPPVLVLDVSYDIRQEHPRCIKTVMDCAVMCRGGVTQLLCTSPQWKMTVMQPPKERTLYKIHKTRWEFERFIFSVN